ncbi:cystatin-A/B [Pelomyxa schiedti]|nr:cystatin-A/B [Pelomyxa schiedti]
MLGKWWKTVAAVVVIVVVVCVGVVWACDDYEDEEPMMAGGLGKTYKCTEDVSAIVLSVKDRVEAITGSHYDTYVPISFRSQVVAGVNYFIKVNVGDTCLHIRIWSKLYSADGPRYDVTSVQPGHTESDPILLILSFYQAKRGTYLLFHSECTHSTASPLIRGTHDLALLKSRYQFS